MPDGIDVGGGILHLAPVARECPRSWDGCPGVRRADSRRGLPALGGSRRGGPAGPPDQAALAVAGDCDAIVLSRQESEVCAELLARGAAGGALVAITAESEPNTLLLPDGTTATVPVPPLGAPPADDLGAGDVYAAALFVVAVAGRSPQDAARFANAAAAVRMLGRGPGAIAEPGRGRGRPAALGRAVSPGRRLRSGPRARASVTSPARPHARIARIRLPATGGISTLSMPACGANRGDLARERADEHLARPEAAADQPDREVAGQPGLVHDRGDLLREQTRPLAHTARSRRRRPRRRACRFRSRTRRCHPWSSAASRRSSRRPRRRARRRTRAPHR